MRAGEVAAFDRLGPDARAAYRADGVVRLRGWFDANWVARADRGIWAGLRRPGRFFRDHTPPGSDGRYLFDFWTWPDNPLIASIALDPAAGELAGRLMDSPAVRMVMDNWFVREPGAAAAAPWHHDEPYFDFHGRLCVVWVPMVSVAADAALKFVRGSHRWGGLYRAAPFSERFAFRCEGPAYRRLPDVARTCGDRIVASAVDAGDALVFDFRTLHAGGTGRGTGHRALTLRFGATGTRFRPRGPWTRVISDYLRRQGQAAGQELCSRLTPVTWRDGIGRPKV